RHVLPLPRFSPHVPAPRDARSFLPPRPEPPRLLLRRPPLWRLALLPIQRNPLRRRRGLPGATLSARRNPAVARYARLPPLVLRQPVRRGQRLRLRSSS